MKPRLDLFFFGLAIAASTPEARAQGTAFTYQGHLHHLGSPANGFYDMAFWLWDGSNPNLSVLVGGPITHLNVTVNNGLFTVPLDFGANVFATGTDRSLAVGVRTNGAGSFTVLSPRQNITAAPYAISAGNLTGILPGGGLSGTYSSAVTLDNAANSFTGNGSGLTSLNASELTSGTVPGARLSGTYPGALIFNNAGNIFTGTFLGNAADSAAAPSFTWSNDANTGLFRPAADQLALATAGSERLRIDSAGNVGIGTTSPQADLHLRGKGSPGSLIVTPNLSDSQSQLLLAENASASIGFILRYAGDEGSNPLHFIPLTNSVEMPPVLTVRRNGYVGLGAATPAANLHLQSAGSLTLWLEADRDNANEAHQPQILLSQDGGIITGRIGFFDSLNHLSLRTFDSGAGAPHLLLEPEGNVGIGTSSPAVALDTFSAGGTAGGAGSSEVIARFRQTETNRHGALAIDTPTGRDSILYFAQDGAAKWGLRFDDQLTSDLVFGTDHFQLRYHAGGANRIALDARTTPGSDDFTFLFYGGVRPWLDGEWSLGGPNLVSLSDGGRWKDVWAVNGFIQTSDAREKRDVRDLEAGLDEILRLRPVSFRWKKFDYGRTHMGLIAQEAQAVIPDAVVAPGHPDGTLGMNYTDLVPVLIKAAQEQHQIVQRQGQQIEDLHQELARRDQVIESLSERLDRFEQRLSSFALRWTDKQEASEFVQRLEVMHQERDGGPK